MPQFNLYIYLQSFVGVLGDYVINMLQYIHMTKQQILEKHARSMARSMEVEGADYHEMEKIILAGVRKKHS